MSHGTVLVIGSNATRIEVRGGGDGPTGNYLNETVVPIFAILAAGYDVVLGTPTGGKPHIDEASDSAAHFGGDTAAYQRARDYFSNDKAMNDVRSLRSVIDEGLDKIDAIFVPGGQAPVVDLMQDPDMGEILRYFHENNKVTALLCHGPIATLAALPDAKAYRAALVAGDTEKAEPGRGSRTHHRPEPTHRSSHRRCHRSRAAAQPRRRRVDCFASRRSPEHGNTREGNGYPGPEGRP